MKYYIKQKVFAIGDKYKIEDEAGNVCYYAKQKIISIKNQFRFYDKKDNEVFAIKQRLFHIMAHYDIIINDTIIATIVQKFRFFKREFNIISASKDELTINGNYLAWDFTIRRNGNIVAVINKKFMIRDRYTIDILDKDDTELCLACVVVLDTLLHNNKNN